jgi:putative hydrolase of the HAD superfamily
MVQAPKEGKSAGSHPDRQVDAVVLDLGNVLVLHDNELLLTRFRERAGREASSPLISDALWGAIQSGQLDAEGIRREVCASLGAQLSTDEFDRIWNCHFTVNRAILPLVESLVGRVRLALLSNTNVIHMDYLAGELPILRRFDCLVLSHEVKKMKPEPAIFHEALRRVSAQPERAAFFDDFLDYVEAARSLGMRGYQFRSVDEFAAQLRELGLR